MMRTPTLAAWSVTTHPAVTQTSHTTKNKTSTSTTICDFSIDIELQGILSTSSLLTAADHFYSMYFYRANIDDISSKTPVIQAVFNNSYVSGVTSDIPSVETGLKVETCACRSEICLSLLLFRLSYSFFNSVIWGSTNMNVIQWACDYLRYSDQPRECIGSPCLHQPWAKPGAATADDAPVQWPPSPAEDLCRALKSHRYCLTFYILEVYLKIFRKVQTRK